MQNAQFICAHFLEGGFEMRLEIGNFYVRNIIFGEKLSFESGILTINKDERLPISEQMSASQRRNSILQNLGIRFGYVR